MSDVISADTGARGSADAAVDGRAARVDLLARQYLYSFEELLVSLQRLARRVRKDEYALLLVERLHDQLEGLDALIWPTAADLVRHGMDVEVALSIIDRRVAHVRRPERGTT